MSLFCRLFHRHLHVVVEPGRLPFGLGGLVWCAECDRGGATHRPHALVMAR